MKKLPWTVWESEKDGVAMLIIMKADGAPFARVSKERRYNSLEPAPFKKWDDYKFKYFIPLSSNSHTIRKALKYDHNARFRSRRAKGGDDCWYSDEWVEDLRELAEAVSGNIPVFNSEES